MKPSKATIIALIESDRIQDLELARDMINDLICQAVMNPDRKTEKLTNLPF